MERVGILQRSRSGSYSSHSLVRDDTDIISEVEEINEVKALRKEAERLLLSGKLNEVVRCYADALEIDERNVDVLSLRASTYMSLNDYHSAYQDSEKLINLDSKKAEAYYLKATALEHLGRTEDAVAAFLETLSFDLDDIATLSDHLIDLVGKLCCRTVETTNMASLKELEAYPKLCKLGWCLYKAGYYALCVQDLNVADRFKTNQTKLQMKALLTMGHAQVALKNHVEAVQAYQDCYVLSAESHDHYYQTKSLVSLATLLTETNDAYRAIYYYELLLDFELELHFMMGALPDYWIPSLRCALRLNLSIAYKSIGNLKRAILYAKMYLDYVGAEAPADVTGESWFNIGALYEILGSFNEAIHYYNGFLKQMRGNKSLTAKAHGALASVYGHLHNWRLAQAYSEQRCEMAQSLGEDELKIAVLQLADLHLTRWNCEHPDFVLEKGNHRDVEMNKAGEKASEEEPESHLQKAREGYLNVIELSKLDGRTRAKALLGLSRCYMAERLYHYASYHLDSALHLAETLRWDEPFPKHQLSRDDTRVITSLSKSMTSMDVKPCVPEPAKSKSCLEKEKTKPTKYVISEADSDLQNEITHDLAECLSWSLSANDLDKAAHYFESLITIYRDKIAQFDTGASTVPPEIPSKLRSAYARLTLAYVRLGRLTDALRCLETSRDYDVTKSYDDVTMTMPDVIVPRGLKPMVAYDQILRVVNENGLTLICYSLIGELLITWVLKPVDGLVATVTSQFPGSNYGTKIRNALDKYNEHETANTHTYCENRALPRRGREIERSQRLNESPRKYTTKVAKSGHNEPLETLYELLIFPIEEHLTGNIVIIPDGILWRIPFSLLTKNGVQLHQKVRITMSPNFKLLMKTLESHKKRLVKIEQLKFERKSQRYAGLRHVLEKDKDETFVQTRHKNVEKINPKKTSHPRFVHLKGRVLSPGEDVTIEIDEVVDNVVTLRTLLGDTLTTLTSNTWTGTDIVASSRVVPKFRQLSSHDRAVVIGAPELPESLTLHGYPWKPTVLQSCLRELADVSKYLNITSISGRECTKQVFLDVMKSATFLHIATWMCADHGYLAMAPNEEMADLIDGATMALDAPSEWLVTPNDIIRHGCPAQLVILSGGWSTRRDKHDSELILVRMFLQAGAQCVLYTGWPVSDFAREKIFFNFYKALSEGCSASEALTKSAPENGEACPFMLVGRDVKIDVSALRSAMLDQLIDTQEAKTIESGADYLNPAEFKEELTEEEKKHELQLLLIDLMRTHRGHEQIIPAVTDLLDSTVKRFHVNEYFGNVVTLDNRIHDGGITSGLELLKFLGFAFQARHNEQSEPYVVFPYADVHGLLVPVYDALRGIIVISDNATCLNAVLQYLPQTQEKISAMVDLLCLSKHLSAEVQLRVSDQSVNQLWNHNLSRDLMTSLGYHQIGPLLGSSRSPEMRRFQSGVLQLLLSLSSQKDVSMMHKLDITNLGVKPMAIGVVKEHSHVPSRPSLQPNQIGRTDVVMTTPWLSRYEKESEMLEKMKLAKRKKKVELAFSHDVSCIKSWHQMWLKNQAKEMLDLVGKRPEKPKKVKVVATSCQASARRSVNYKAPPTLEQIHDRRVYSHVILQQRLLAADEHKKQQTKKIILPYIVRSSQI